MEMIRGLYQYWDISRTFTSDLFTPIPISLLLATKVLGWPKGKLEKRTWVFRLLSPFLCRKTSYEKKEPKGNWFRKLYFFHFPFRKPLFIQGKTWDHPHFMPAISCRTISCWPISCPSHFMPACPISCPSQIMSIPFHVRLSHFMSVPFHVGPISCHAISCPSHFMPGCPISCPTDFMLAHFMSFWFFQKLSNLSKIHFKPTLILPISPNLT